MRRGKLRPGDLVQLSPDTGNQMLACCFMVITEPKSFGAMGYVQCTGTGGKSGGLAYYRAPWAEMEPVGRAVWTTPGVAEAEAGASDDDFTEQQFDPKGEQNP